MVAASLGEVVRRKFIYCVCGGGEETIQLWKPGFGVISCVSSHDSLVSHRALGWVLSSEHAMLFLPVLATPALLVFYTVCPDSALIKWGPNCLCRFEVRKWAGWKQTGFSGSFVTSA